MNPKVWKSHRAECLSTAPTFLWLAVFLLIPSLILVISAFRESSSNGWTWENFRQALSPALWPVLGRTLAISLLVSVACLLLALPVAWFLAKAPARWRSLLLMAVVIPFWTNFLIRIFSWRQLLHPEGWIKKCLVTIGWCEPGDILLYNDGAVALVSLYLYLPFAILPIYAALEKFDPGLLDAARDLGAGRRAAIGLVLLPGISRGIGTAFLLVFIPMLGSYVVPDLVGSVDSEMLGNLIARRNLVDRNLPQASALAVVLTLTILLPTLTWYFGKNLYRQWREGRS